MIDYYKEIFQYIKKNIFDKDLAHDVTQETFARAIKSADLNQIENERALLYRIAKNVMFDLYKEKNKINKISFDEEEYTDNSNTTEENIIKDEEVMLLMKSLDNLPKKRRQAFILHIVDGYTREEVAELMGISLNAVEQHISRASNQIKENLIKEENNAK
ncbi:RNA polymerase sigma factor [Aliarcobacter butzleri]|uniref:RNA polymerase sigma factor n=1 Tax=Aliarcobacter butzleri TaxID=28197 RepID=UPI001EDB4608|nr:RNA polymerase sigma factor [Aliarcobacter butzleri]MCG3659322.1 RNA polymerase sigma factor [Aliarcobacter butzleri]